MADFNSFVSMISDDIIINTNELKSAMDVVEVNGEDCVGHHSKKDGVRQDPSL